MTSDSSFHYIGISVVRCPFVACFQVALAVSNLTFDWRGYKAAAGLGE